MWVYDNDTVSDTFIVDLTEDRDVQDNLPCNFLSVRNDSSLVAFVYLDNKKVGAVQAYSSDPFIGKNFEIIMIKQPDGNNFAIGDLFLQVGKNEQMSSTPYNPSWDLMEENIDVYASGCNDRISYSSLTPITIIKSIINYYNNLIVQRRLSVQGSASLGSYEIIFDPKTIIAGGVPINGEVLDTKQYKKIIQNSEFDYTITNASIKGWMIDLNVTDLKTDNDIPYGFITFNTNPGNEENSFDDDESTVSDYIEVSTVSEGIYSLDIAFPVRTINNLYIKLGVVNPTGTHLIRTRIFLNLNDSWTQITTNAELDSASATEVIKTVTQTTKREKCNGLRVEFRHTTNAQLVKNRFYEISLLPK